MREDQTTTKIAKWCIALVALGLVFVAHRVEENRQVAKAAHSAELEREREERREGLAELWERGRVRRENWIQSAPESRPAPNSESAAESRPLRKSRPATEACEITGTVPSELREEICEIATSAHGGDAPVNQLTVMLVPSWAVQVRKETLGADNMLLQLLDAWTRLRDVRVAQVEAFYGAVHLATVETHAFSRTSVTFH